jgi:hypothetical protein
MHEYGWTERNTDRQTEEQMEIHGNANRRSSRLSEQA